MITFEQVKEAHDEFNRIQYENSFVIDATLIQEGRHTKNTLRLKREINKAHKKFRDLYEKYKAQEYEIP